MLRRALIILAVFGVVASAGVALADGFQTTTPDACAVLKRTRVAAVLGGRVVSHPERFPLPELPRGESDINRFLDVAKTGCTWIDPAVAASGRLTAINVRVHRANPEYNGPTRPGDGPQRALPWTPLYEREILAQLGSRGSYQLVDNDKLARKIRAPWLAGEDLMLVWDRATRGQRKVILGIDDDDGLWIAVSVTADGRSAIEIAVAVTRHLLGA